MEPAQIQALIREAVADAFDEHTRINATEHADHHLYLKSLIEKDKKRADMYSKVSAHVVGWVIVGTITYLGAAVIEYIRAHLTRGL